MGNKNLVIAGVEAHICVMKTALDAVDKSYLVYVAADAIGSRTFENKIISTLIK